jgi:hypothetical protein
MTATESKVHQRFRRERLMALLAEYGCACGCDAYGNLVTSNVHYEGGGRYIGRFALLEADKGSAGSGGPWWTTGDDWRALLRVSASQEDPQDWPAETLFDLDYDGEIWSTRVEQAILYEPEDEPAP